MVRGSGRTAAPVMSQPAYLQGTGDVAYRPPGVIRQMGGYYPHPPQWEAAAGARETGRPS